MGKSHKKKEFDVELQNDAIRAAFPKLRQIDTEASNLKARKETEFEKLRAVGVTKKVMQEAMKRAKTPEDQLSLFDQQAARAETVLRQVIAGNPPEDPDDAEEGERETETPDGDDPTPIEAAAKPKGKKEKPGATVHQLKGHRAAAAGKVDAASAPNLPPARPQADADANVRGPLIQAEPGAEGVSMDKIPMPGAPAQTGFVDRQERMTTAEYNAEVAGGGLDG